MGARGRPGGPFAPGALRFSRARAQGAKSSENGRKGDGRRSRAPRYHRPYIQNDFGRFMRVSPIQGSLVFCVSVSECLSDTENGGT